MKKLQMSLLSVMAVGLLAGPAMVEKAAAQIRVDATVTTPNVRIRVGNAPSAPRIFRKNPYEVRRACVVITKQDRLVARRLSRYTGVPARRLLDLKRDGFSWFQIGRHLDMSRPAVRAAMHERSWQRFLRHERHMARCDHRGHRLTRVVYYDD